MKTIINKFFLVSAVVMALTACSDFLDKEPLSQGTEAIVFKTPEHFEQAANALYNVIGWKNLDDKPSYDDIMDRGTDISGLGSNGGGSAPEENWSWDKPYSPVSGYCLFFSCMAAFLFVATFWWCAYFRPCVDCQ